MRRLLLVLAVVLLAACGGEQVSEQLAEQAIGGDADVDISGEGDEVTVNIESDEGSLSFGSGASLPDELEVPVPEGGNVTAAGTQGDTAFAAVQYPGDRYDEIVGFYDDWTAATGDEWETQTMTLDIGEETQRAKQWVNPGDTHFISVSDCIDIEEGSGALSAACITINRN